MYDTTLRIVGRLGKVVGALLGDPRVLVLDEPANGLDRGIRWLRDFLRDFVATLLTAGSRAGVVLAKTAVSSIAGAMLGALVATAMTATSLVSLSLHSHHLNRSRGRVPNHRRHSVRGAVIGAITGEYHLLATVWQ